VIKRCADVTLALAGIVLLLPLFVLTALLIRLDSAGPVMFVHERIGRSFRPFRMYKFRTMRADAPLDGSLVTVRGDTRVTRIGRLLRRTKLDELPQLINVLRGEMSLVGPRPEVRRFVEQFRSDYEELLTVRPGITDPASLKYRDEEAILARAACPEDYYVQQVLPDKIQLSKKYVQSASFIGDLFILLRTIFRLT
jgi:lipopolysaccharide/colanic/teichoic acid biosynthesis glycosyltransferase